MGLLDIRSPHIWQVSWPADHLVEKDPSLDSLPADGTLGHPVPAHLAGTVATQEDHVLKPAIRTNLKMTFQLKISTKEPAAVSLTCLGRLGTWSAP